MVLVPIEVPTPKYFRGPQNYNPEVVLAGLFRIWHARL